MRQVLRETPIVLPTIPWLVLIPRAKKAIVGEIYNPPRLSLAARKRGHSASISYDLKTGWDFSLESHRDQSLADLSKKEVELLRKEGF